MCFIFPSCVRLTIFMKCEDIKGNNNLLQIASPLEEVLHLLIKTDLENSQPSVRKLQNSLQYVIGISNILSNADIKA